MFSIFGLHPRLIQISVKSLDNKYATNINVTMTANCIYTYIIFKFKKFILINLYLKINQSENPNFETTLSYTSETQF